VAGGRWLLGEGAPGQKGALGEAHATGRNPTDRGKSGTKRHTLTEGRGVPLAVVLSGANRHDMKKLADLLDAVVLPVPAAPAAGDGPHLCLDRGYDFAACREAATTRGYTPHIPPKASAAQPLPPPGDPARHPPRRWVVEVAHAWFNRFRRLLIRWEKQAAHYLAFVQLAACLIVYRKLRHAQSLSG
jgi:putative transposase